MYGNSSAEHALYPPGARTGLSARCYWASFQNSTLERIIHTSTSVPGSMWLVEDLLEAVLPSFTRAYVASGLIPDRDSLWNPHRYTDATICHSQLLQTLLVAWALDDKCMTSQLSQGAVARIIPNDLDSEIISENSGKCPIDHRGL